jgi:hypothetical protein
MMHSHLKKLLCLAFLMSGASVCAVSPYISIRSQGLDSARDLVGLTNLIYRYNTSGNMYGVFSVTPEFTSSFKSKRIFDSLFKQPITCTPPSTSTACGTLSCATDCKNECPCITISGSRVENRGCCDWLADYFGLPTDFSSRVCFKPRIQNSIIDFNFFLGLDDVQCGFYLRIDVPFVRTKWNLKFCETVTNAGELGYDSGYFGSVAVPRSGLRNNFCEFATGQRDLFINDQQNSINVTVQKLQFARFSPCDLTDTGIAEIRTTIGYNFIQDECTHFGLNLRMAAPTGRRPHGDFIFEPMVGNGKHWEFGGGMTAHYTFWENECANRSLGIWFEGYITSLFKTRQRRTFDLKGKPNSRYMLAERLGTPVAGLFANPLPGNVTGSVAPVAQFKNQFTPVANLTTFDVNVSSGIQADLTLLLNYTRCDHSFDIGYNFWSRSCEKIDYYCKCAPRTLLSDGSTWALKGDAAVYGFTQGEVVEPIALSATESLATINAGTNTPCGTPFAVEQQANPGIDNAQFARDTSGLGFPGSIFAGTAGLRANIQTRTSFNPVFLTENDIDFCGARTRGLSSKVFAHWSYTWNRCECWIPFLGIGGKVEFAHSRNRNCCNTNINVITAPTTGVTQTACGLTLDNCRNNRGCSTTNISEWGIWLKGGVAFN